MWYIMVKIDKSQKGEKINQTQEKVEGIKLIKSINEPR